MKTFFTILLVILIQFANTAQVNLDSGLVAYYPFNGNAIDQSGNGNNGIVSGASLASDRFGNNNSAYQFNGISNNITVPENVTLNFATQITLSAWVKRTRIGIDVILEKGGDWTLGTCNYGMALHEFNNNMFYFFFNGGWRGTDGVNDFEWHHYAVVAEHGSANPLLYIDGELKSVQYSEGSLTINLALSNKDLHIGAQLGTYSYYGANIIDEVKIYNRLLNSLEISRLALNKLVAYYPFNGNANDESGNNINPTYIGSGVTLTSDRFGLNNRAFYFDGNDGSYIRLPADSFPTTSRTISLWINAMDLNGGKVPFCYGGNGCSTSSHLMILNQSNNSAYRVVGHCNQSSISYTYTSQPLNTWKHWVITIEGATQKLYIDGELKQTENNYSGSAYVEGRSAIIGGLLAGDGNTVYVDPTAGYFKGKIDDIRIYNHAITDQEVIALYHDSTTYTPPTLEDGLIAFYPFTGNPHDQSPTGNHATVIGATLTKDRFGVDNNAYYFNGSGRLQAADNQVYDFGPGNFSMNAWVNIETINTSRIVSAGYNDNDGIWGLGFGTNPVWGSGNRINFFVYSNNSFQDFSSEEITNYTVGTWAFVSVVKQNNTLKFFFNGQEAGSLPMIFQANSNSFLSIGCRQQASSVFDEFLIGKIDDIRIYNRSLSNEEIFSLYNDSTTYHPPLEEGLVAYWPLDGNTNDSTFNNNDGINYNGVFSKDRYGNDNSSIYFNGSDSYVEGINPGNNLPAGNSPRTFSAWIKENSFHPWGNNIFHYGLDQAAPTNFHFYTTNNIRIGNGYDYGVVFGNTIIVDSTWHFVTGVYNGGTEHIAKVYVDGKLDATGVISTEPNTILGSNWKIGRFMTGSNNFDGDIDELKVYNVALSDQQIWDMYKTTTTAPTLLYPGNDSTLINPYPTIILDWDSTVTANQYRLLIASDSLFNTAIKDTIINISSIVLEYDFFIYYDNQYWKVRTINDGGAGPWSEVNHFNFLYTDVKTEDLIPTEFALMQNYPNPFNPSTLISYKLPVSSNVTLKVYDVLGKEVATLVDEEKPAGVYEINFNSNNLASGVYLYKLQAGGFTETRKMILMR